jgi:hypothetical protein
MKLTRTKHSLLVGSAMDKAFDAYLEWRDRSEAVQTTYSMWTAASCETAAIAFRAYVVALDREENAANRYTAIIEEVRSIVAPGFAEDALKLEAGAGA